jgi:hypothetical protein
MAKNEKGLMLERVGEMEIEKTFLFPIHSAPFGCFAPAHSNNMSAFQRFRRKRHPNPARPHEILQRSKRPTAHEPDQNEEESRCNPAPSNYSKTSSMH